MRRVFSIFAAAAVMSVVQAGFAGEPAGGAAGAGGQDAAGAGEKVTAEDLFQQGIELIKKGQWAEAAAKLEESNRLDRAAGTTINLADCYEHMGKLASAWTLFVEAATAFGRRAPPDPRADTAKSRAEALYPRLSRLTIEVPEAVRATKGLVVKRDGEDVGAAQFGTGIAVDPGVHVVEVSAPGKKDWKAEVKVEGEAAKVAVAVPALADAPVEGGGAGAAGDKGEAGEQGGWPWQRKVAVGAAGVGVAGVVVGAIMGVDAMGKHGELEKECNAGEPRVCTAKGLSIVEGERTSGTVSTIGFAAGGALIAAGVVLWLVAPSGGGEGAKGRPAAKVWVAPQVGARTGVSAGVVW